MKRFSQLVAGLALYGFANALMLNAGLGLPPWSVFHQGLSRCVGISFGMATIVTGIAVLLVWVPLRQRIGLGTILNVAIIGPAADLSLHFLPTVAALPARLLLMAAGILLTGLASGLYIGAGFEPGPRDGIMTGLARRTGMSVRVIRTGIELFVLAAGFLLGGTIGAGTLAFALLIGPLFQFFLPRFNWSPRASADDIGEEATASTHPLPKSVRSSILAKARWASWK